MRFAFNCYRHWSTQVIRAGYGMGQFLFRKEGVTQGDTLVMVEYGIGIIPFIRECKKTHTGITHPWYADDAGSGGNFEGIWQHLDDLMVRGGPRGYFTELTKSILVVSPRNVPRVEALFRGYGLQIATVSRFLGGFVGIKEAQDRWKGEKVDS